MTTEQPEAGPMVTIDCDDCGQVVAVPRDGSQAACGCAGVLWSLSPSRVKLSREQDAKIAALERARDNWQEEARVRAQNTDFWRQNAEALEAERDRMEITTARALTENMALTSERDRLRKASATLLAMLTAMKMVCHNCHAEQTLSFGVTEGMKEVRAALEGTATE